MLAIGLIALSSACDKQTEPQIEQVQINSIQGKTIQTNLSIEITSDALRLAQQVDAMGAPVAPFISTNDLVILVAVRPQGSTNKNEYKVQELTFQSDGNEVKYSGSLEVPQTTDPLEISGILLAEITDSSTGSRKEYTNKVDATGLIVGNLPATQFSTIATNSTKVETKIPYIATWQALNPKPDDNTTYGHTFVFEPSGTLVRLRIYNGLSENLEVDKIRIHSNVFVGAWQYDFAYLERNNPHSTLMQGSKTHSSGVYFTQTYSSPITLAPDGNSEWMYLWLMPLRSVSSNDTEISVIMKPRSGATLPDAYHFRSTSTLNWGSVQMNLRVYPSTNHTIGYNPN